MLGFKAIITARVILSGIEMIHMLRNSRRNMPAVSSSRSLGNSSSSLHERVAKTYHSLTLPPICDGTGKGATPQQSAPSGGAASTSKTWLSLISPKRAKMSESRSRYAA
jgi:hypothetical protein